MLVGCNNPDVTRSNCKRSCLKTFENEYSALDLKKGTELSHSQHYNLFSKAADKKDRCMARCQLAK